MKNWVEVLKKCLWKPIFYICILQTEWSAGLTPVVFFHVLLTPWSWLTCKTLYSTMWMNAQACFRWIKYTTYVYGTHTTLNFLWNLSNPVLFYTKNIRHWIIKGSKTSMVQEKGRCCVVDTSENDGKRIKKYKQKLAK